MCIKSNKQHVKVLSSLLSHEINVSSIKEDFILPRKKKLKETKLHKGHMLCTRKNQKHKNYSLKYNKEKWTP